MTIQLINSTVANQWVSQGIPITVENYVDGLTGLSDIGAISTAIHLTYAQVSWALGYLANRTIDSVMAIPTQESEVMQAIEMNRMWR